MILDEEEYERLLDAYDVRAAEQVLADDSDPVVDWSEAGRELITVRIAEARKARGMTQRELARKLGIRPSTVSRWERKDANLTLVTLRKIAQTLGCRVQHLV